MSKSDSLNNIAEFVDAQTLLDRHFNEVKLKKAQLTQITEENFEESQSELFSAIKNNNDLAYDSAHKVEHDLKEGNQTEETPAFQKNRPVYEFDKKNEEVKSTAKAIVKKPQSTTGDVFSNFLCNVDLSVRQPSPKREDIYGKDKIDTEVIKKILSKKI